MGQLCALDAIQQDTILLLKDAHLGHENEIQSINNLFFSHTFKF